MLSVLFPPYLGNASLESRILESDVIARVSYLSHSQGSVMERPSEFLQWTAVLEFRFRVHEYLKGTGPDEIGGLVYLKFNAEPKAQAAAAQMAPGHDTRWAARQAIVFLKLPSSEIEDHGAALPTASDQYVFGRMLYPASGYGWVDNYTISSIHRKLWLPVAQPPGASGMSDSNRLFLLDAPANATTTTMMLPTLSQSGLAAKVTAIEAEANAGGTPQHRKCVEESYWFENSIREQIKRIGPLPHWQYTGAIESGLSAGTFVADLHPWLEPSEEQVGMGWFDGPDKDLLTHTNVDFRSAGGDVEFSWRVVTTRPLPAGEYTAYPNQPWFGTVCDRYPEIARKHRRFDLTVTPPANTLHEAFFDPVDIGNAVGADSYSGVLEPASFDLNGVATTVTSLKHENGAVTLGLSPAASLYAVDFIDLTGATTLSLTSENASPTALVWTVPDAPWADGDKFMLRIRQQPPPVTVTLAPRPQGSATRVNITIEWNDPQTCDGEYLVALYTSSDYMVQFLGYTPASETPSRTTESATDWVLSRFPDWFAGVTCYPNASSDPARDLGRVSLRAAHPDSN